MAEANKQTVTINNQEFDTENWSDNAKALLNNIRVADAKLQQLNQEIGLVRTARNTFSQALAREVPALAEASEANVDTDKPVN